MTQKVVTAMGERRLMLNYVYGVRGFKDPKTGAFPYLPPGTRLTTMDPRVGRVKDGTLVELGYGAAAYRAVEFDGNPEALSFDKLKIGAEVRVIAPPKPKFSLEQSVALARAIATT